MSRFFAFAIVLFTTASIFAADENPTDWIDPSTGHRVIRLSQQMGSRTFYFHDNSYTPEGDKLAFNTQEGVAIVDITKLGTEPPKMEIIGQGTGAIMARKTREIYLAQGGGRGRGRGRGGNGAATEPSGVAATPSTQPGFGSPGGGNGGPVFAINIDTKAQRQIANAVSTIISCDETWGFVLARDAVDPTGKTPRPATRPYVSQLQRMFPGRTMAELPLNQQYAVQKEEGLARRTLDPSPAAFTFINLKTGEH